MDSRLNQFCVQDSTLAATCKDLFNNPDEADADVVSILFYIGVTASQIVCLPLDFHHKREDRIKGTQIDPQLDFAVLQGAVRKYYCAMSIENHSARVLF